MTRHPRVGGLLLSVTDAPQSTKAWQKGAQGERQLGALLDGLAEPDTVVLHDRRIPKTRANIDHLVVTRAGVWVIDAKHYRGRVSRRDIGGWIRRDERLFVDGRDRTALVTAMTRQVMAVTTALGDTFSIAPVQPILCFIDAEWRLFPKPFSVDGVTVTWPTALLDVIRRAPTTASVDVDAVATRLGRALPLAR